MANLQEPELTSEPQTTEPEAPQAELDVTVVVPVQTGDAEIQQVVEALGGELDRLGRSWECIVVLDGVRGTAGETTAALVRSSNGRVRSLSFERAFGESACLSAALEKARGRLILTTPPYVQVDPFEIGGMIEAIDAGADFVAPWRHPRVDPVINRIQSSIFNWVMRRIIRMSFHDLNCYFRLVRREVLENLTIYGDMYRFLPVIASRQGYKVVEGRVRHLKEWGSGGLFGTGLFGVGVYVRRFLDILGVVFLTRFTLKPLRFFGTLGAALAGLGFVMSAVLFFQWAFLQYDLFGRPSFFVAVVLIVLGVQVIGFGLVGEIIIFTQAKNLREYRIERIYE